MQIYYFFKINIIVHQKFIIFFSDSLLLLLILLLIAVHGELKSEKIWRLSETCTANVIISLNASCTCTDIQKFVPFDLNCNDNGSTATSETTATTSKTVSTFFPDHQTTTETTTTSTNSVPTIAQTTKDSTVTERTN